MSVKNSAEIVELEDARARLRASEIDARNFLSVGAYLEAVREQQGLSIATLSDRTHVRANYIEAIEQMAFDALPSKPYAIGFVRVLAEALGLDAAPVVDRFKSETGFAGAKPVEAVKAAAEPAVKGEPMGLSLIAVLAILAFMIWCAWIVTHPGPDAVTRPLKLDGVPLAPTLIESSGVAPAAAPGEPPAFDPGLVPPLPVIVEAAPVERIEPVYPPACEAGASPAETVDLAFTITPEGAVVSERVVRSSNACFDRAALNAIKRWRFSPRTVDGAARPAFEQTARFEFKRP